MRNPGEFLVDRLDTDAPGTAQPFFPPSPAGISPLERLWNGFQIQTPNFSGIRIPEFGEFWCVESGILGFGIRNTAQGIRNPTND